MGEKVRTWWLIGALLALGVLPGLKTQWDAVSAAREAGKAVGEITLSQIWGALPYLCFSAVLLLIWARVHALAATISGRAVEAGGPVAGMTTADYEPRHRDLEKKIESLQEHSDKRVEQESDARKKDTEKTNGRMEDVIDKLGGQLRGMIDLLGKQLRDALDALGKKIEADIANAVKDADGHALERITELREEVEAKLPKKKP